MKASLSYIPLVAAKNAGNRLNADARRIQHRCMEHRLSYESRRELSCAVFANDRNPILAKYVV
jgi:hypothetical protein